MKSQEKTDRLAIGDIVTTANRFAYDMLGMITSVGPDWPDVYILWFGWPMPLPHSEELLVLVSSILRDEPYV